MDLELLPLNMSLFNFNSRPDLDMPVEDKGDMVEIEKQPVSSKYDDDVAVLTNKFGELSNRIIEVSLTEMLEIIPKQRRRVDAYNGLVKWLSTNLNTTLAIKSNKYGNKEN